MYYDVLKNNGHFILKENFLTNSININSKNQYDRLVLVYFKEKKKSLECLNNLGGDRVEDIKNKNLFFIKIKSWLKSVI
jgi:hypothetical protein